MYVRDWGKCRLYVYSWDTRPASSSANSAADIIEFLESRSEWSRIRNSWNTVRSNRRSKAWVQYRLNTLTVSLSVSYKVAIVFLPKVSWSFASPANKLDHRRCMSLSLTFRSFPWNRQSNPDPCRWHLRLCRFEARHPLQSVLDCPYGAVHVDNGWSSCPFSFRGDPIR